MGSEVRLPGFRFQLCDLRPVAKPLCTCLPTYIIWDDDNITHLIRLCDKKVSMQNDTWHFSSIQLLSHVQLLATSWTVARQASLSITNSRSLLKLTSIALVMPSNHLILCCPLLLPSIFPSIRAFSNESCLALRKHLRHGIHYDFTGVDTKLFTLAFQFPALKQIPLHI